MGSLGFGNHWSKYETKRPKNLTMLCSIHILKGNKVITDLLVKLFTCQITSKPSFFVKNEVYWCYRYCLKLFGKMKKESEFRQQCYRNCKTKYNVLGEREKIEF